MKRNKLFSKIVLRKWPAVVALIIGVTVIGLITIVYQGRATSPLTEINSIEDLRILFNQDKNFPRIILLMSPT